MASIEHKSTIESSAIDWNKVQNELWGKRDSLLRQELCKGQDTFSSFQIDNMSHEEKAHHILTLRQMLGDPRSVKRMIHDFGPTPFVHSFSYPGMEGNAFTPPLTQQESKGQTFFRTSEQMGVDRGGLLLPGGVAPCTNTKGVDLVQGTSVSISSSLSKLSTVFVSQQAISSTMIQQPISTSSVAQPLTSSVQISDTQMQMQMWMQMLMLEKEERKRKEEKEDRIRAEEKEERIRMEERKEKIRKEEREAELQRLDRIRQEDIERQDRLRIAEERDRQREKQNLAILEEERRQEAREAKERLERKLQAKLDKERREQEHDMLLGVRLRRATDATRGSLYPMPSDPMDVIPYFSQIERVFENCNVDKDLRINLLTPFLTESARRSVLMMPSTDFNDYDTWKESILRDYRLTPTTYKIQFNSAVRAGGESCGQFATRLRALLSYYLQSRNIKTLEDLTDLILADRLRESLHPNSRHMIMDREQDGWFKVNDMAKTVDLFEVSRGYNMKNREIRNKNDKFVHVKAITVAHDTENSKNLNYKRAEWRQKIVCFNCSIPGHFAKECNKPKNEQQKPKQENKRTPFCLFCRMKGHLTKFCRKRPTFSNEEDTCYLCGKVTHKAKDCEKNKNSKDQCKKVNRVHTVGSDILNDDTLAVKSLNYESRDILLQKGLVSLAGVISDFVCDSGTQISVINSKMIPNGYLNSSSTGKSLDLRSAWGDIAQATVINIPAGLVCDGSVADTEVLICCAVTDRLLDNVALLTVDDVKVLQEGASHKLPTTELITGTHVYYTDPHYMNEQMVRRVEEKVLNRSGRSIGMPLFKPSTLPDLLTSDRESVEDFKKAQEQDASLTTLWKEAGSEDSPLIIKDGLLYRNKDLYSSTVSQLVLPVQYRDQVIYAAHDALWSMHFGHKKTAKRIQLYFWWPTMDSQIKKYVKSCPECQVVARKTKLDRIPIAPVERGIQAFDLVNIDLIGPLPIKSARGHLYVLTAVCSLTRWPMAVPLKTLSAKELCDALITLFTWCGIPRVIVSDNGTNMVSGLTQEVYSRLGIKLRTATAYHPEGNAMVERFNQSLKRMLHHVLAGTNPTDWDRQLPFLLWSYRELPNDTTGVSPHMLVYGQTPKGPLSVLKEAWTGTQTSNKELPRNVQNYLDILKKDLSLCHEVAKDHATELEKSYRSQYNKSARDKLFKIGEQVLVLMPDNAHKLLSKWIGPGLITAELSDHSYRVALDSGSVKELHANHLRRWVPRVNTLGIVFEDDKDFGSIEVYPTDRPDFREDFDKINLQHLNEAHATELKDLIHKFSDIFSNNPGHCNLIEHEINLVDGFKPKPLKQYRMPEKFRDEVDRQIDKLLLGGRVRHSNSEFAHPIIAVSKPDGGVRLCTDLRMVNNGTMNCAYPSVIPEEALIRVCSAPFITTLDCTSGYWQIPLRESDRYKTAFHSNRGLLEWVYMPFGLKTASQTFQKAMDIMLRNDSNHALAYIDDIVVYSFSWDDHIRHLDSVFSVTRKSGMKLKLSKCHFAQARVQYIGHLIGSGQRSIVAEKIAPILNIPEPKNKKLLRSFLGMCSFYRTYIKDFAKISAPLTDLTKKGNPERIRFNPTQQEAFTSLKRSLANSTTLYSPSATLPFIIRTDASDYAVGAVLAQVDNEQEHPIAFASSKLSGPQLNWSTIEKEAYAIIYALQKFDYLVYGREIHLYTDHNPLQYLALTSPKSPKLTRWALSLSRYNIVVHHVAGTQNVTADCLSRCLE